MTFKTILPLSIIAFFVTGSVLFAEASNDNATNTTTTTVSQTTDSNSTPAVASSQTNPNSTTSTTSTSTTTNESGSTSNTSSTRVKNSQKKTTTESTPSVDKEPVHQDPNTTPVSPTRTRVYNNGSYGYSVQQIRNMPMVARPNRPGHFFGNTVRAIYHARRGR